MRRSTTPASLLAVGIHPATGTELLRDRRKSCRNCVEVFPVDAVKVSAGFKCGAVPTLPETKITWPACAVWKPRPKSLRSHDLFGYEGGAA